MQHTLELRKQCKAIVAWILADSEAELLTSLKDVIMESNWYVGIGWYNEESVNDERLHLLICEQSWRFISGLQTMRQ